MWCKSARAEFVYVLSGYKYYLFVWLYVCTCIYLLYDCSLVQARSTYNNNNNSCLTFTVCVCGFYVLPIALLSVRLAVCLIVLFVAALNC